MSNILLGSLYPAPAAAGGGAGANASRWAGSTFAHLTAAVLPTTDEWACSFWLKAGSGADDNVGHLISFAVPTEGASYIQKAGTGANRIVSSFRNATETVVEQIFFSDFGAEEADGWAHYLISCKLSATKADHGYRNLTDELFAIQTEGENYGFGKTSVKWTFGAASAGSPSADLIGDLSEFWMDSNFIDFSSSTNRDKFNQGSTPQSLGADGSTPTGVQPEIYLPDGDPSDNKGSASNFTLSGSLTAVDGPNP